jgi:AraC-like DNA-binding protein
MTIALKDLTFSVRYMEVMDGLLLERGGPRQVLLDALGLTEAQLREPNQTIDGVQYQRALIAALPYCLPGASLSAQYLAHVPLTIVGPLGLLIMASGTLGEALKAVEKYAGVLFPAYAMRMQLIKDEVHMVVSRLSDFGEVDDLLTEIVLGMFIQFQPFLSEPVDGVALHFRHHAGPQTFEHGSSMIRQVHFGALVDEIVFPARLMGIKTLTRSPLLHLEVTRALDQMAKQDHQSQPVSQQARRAIREFLEAGKVLHGDALAQQLQLSRRTLSRRLEEEGATLAGLISEVKLALADTLLLTTALPLADIARRAGFTEVTNFARAYKRQYGRTPRERRSAG